MLDILATGQGLPSGEGLGTENAKPSYSVQAGFHGGGVADAQQAYRLKFIEMVWKGGSIVAALGIPMSLLRAPTVGWQPAHFIHIAIFLFILSGWLFWWRRSSPRVKGAVLVGIPLMIGVAGLLNFGLMANGILFLTYSAFVFSVLFSSLASVVYCLVVFAFIAAVGFCFVTGIAVMGFDANVYAVLPSAWATTVLGSSALFLFSFIAIAVLQNANRDLMDKVQAQLVQIAQLADHDHLTGLPVMRVARDRLDMAIHHARRHDEKVAVLFIDLDGFKAINDTMGHETGDKVLQQVASTLLMEVRDEDTVSRVGGDEFLVILPFVDADAAQSVAIRMLSSLADMLKSGYSQVEAGASIGIALFPDHGATVDVLKHQADQAMYEVKRGGKNGVAFAG